ncbi:DUF4132 domain-containing protein [Paenibacillus rhizovicinus]|uniref:DUF4132 domain-containing protein n=1 Tax=Paenibacillus rhizovicinus TaxID=2704463 RepID=A0A6C0P3T1_9BACL|nr:DUF4132 domain-containing protein [Paenibacillus rhizovicinus]QHW31332.1 DUF4132 domain-containing protein [Paenibacillus rhizovicinus]
MRTASEQKQDLERYIASKREEAARWPESKRRLIEAVLADVEDPTVQSAQMLEKLFWPAQVNHISEALQGERLEVVAKLIGEEHAAMFKAIWDRSVLYPYTSGLSRLPFRSPEQSRLYLPLNLRRLAAAVHFVAQGYAWGVEAVLQDAANHPFLHDWIALAIDQGDDQSLQAVKRVIESDDSGAKLTRNMIKGCLMSHNVEARRAIGELLLSAKLQEGLRQTIMECADETSRESFILMLQLVLETDLLRFPSIVRAFGTWTAIVLDMDKPAVIRKCLQSAYDCLTDRDALTACLNSSDAQLFYIGLWALAVDETAWLQQPILLAIGTGEVYKAVAALELLQHTQQEDFQHKLASGFLINTEAGGMTHLHFLAKVLANLSTHDGTDSAFSLRHRTKLRNATEADIALFRQFRKLLAIVPIKQQTFWEQDYSSYTISADTVCLHMIVLAIETGSEEMGDELLELLPTMSPGTRETFCSAVLGHARNDKQRSALIDALGDKGAGVRHAAMRGVSKLALMPEEYARVEQLLQYKAGDIRQNALELLFKQPLEELKATVGRLLTDKKEEKRLAGLECMVQMRDSERHGPIFEACLGLARGLKQPTSREKVLLDSIVEKDISADDPMHGFGLYDPSMHDKLSPLPEHLTLEGIFRTGHEELKQILQVWSDRIHELRNEEFVLELGDGTQQTLLLSEGEWGFQALRMRAVKPMDQFPFPDVWRELARSQGLDGERLIQLIWYLEAPGSKQFGFKLDDFKENYHTPHLDGLFASLKQSGLQIFKEKLHYSWFIRMLCRALYQEEQEDERYRIVYHTSVAIYNCLMADSQVQKQDNRPRQGRLRFGNGEVHFGDVVDTEEVQFWLKHLQDFGLYGADETEWRDEWRWQDGKFRESFRLRQRIAKLERQEYAGPILETEELLGALEAGILSENEFYRELFEGDHGRTHLHALTRDAAYHRISLEKYPIGQRLTRRAVDRIAEIEMKRGDIATPVSRLAEGIQRFEGARHFVQCLLSLGSESLARGYDWFGVSTKKGSLSRMLKHVFPGAGEDAGTLRALLSGHKVPERRLIEAAMYAPQWIDLVEQVLEWEGLSSACWYFHAHTTDYLTADKETMVGRYSSIPPRQLQEGAFDIDWFHQAYRKLGDKRFRHVYDSAKYIANGANHRRAQLFADAVLGKLQLAELEAEMIEKRNKNYVLCYGLVPMLEKDGDHREDLLHRYEVLQQFLKISKTFGALRRESESAVVQLALENLSRNAGFADLTRMIWHVEAEAFQALSGHFAPMAIGYWEASLAVDEFGQTSMLVTKDGKALKSVPAGLKGYEAFKELKKTQASLKAQLQRARAAFEQAMVNQEAFTCGELVRLEKNPILAPLVGRLVFRTESGGLGWFVDGSLRGVNGDLTVIRGEERLWVAHSFDLYESGEWPQFQRQLFAEKIVQPFKQVFRELYLLTEDERSNGAASGRYGGHQVQQRRAAALFKARRWTVSHQAGLQKVYHRERIMATMYAQADWFTPAEMEAPTLETVEFFHLDTWQRVALADVPPVIFSEVMRDIDLVVSVAHVGGVDPDASLSTIEMRAAMAAELMPLLKLSNVTFKSAHAIIEGVLGEYSVHLGSGVVHQTAGGALHILAVHGQQRGRLFLPFVDDDPRTAEVLSKIIVLAEDRKLKDPTILRQIKQYAGS